MYNTVHSIGLFHTHGTDAHSHCAYTQKTRRIVPMLANMGYKVKHYHAGKFEPIYGYFDKQKCDENIELIQLISDNRLDELRHFAVEELKVSGVFEGDLANVGTSLFAEFHLKLLKEIKRNFNGNEDIFLHHFGWPHKELGNKYPKAIHIEPGIGYPDTFAPYRIFESKAWLDQVTGKKGQLPQYGDFVVPNHFDESYWKHDQSVKKEGVVYMGRIYDMKGCQIFGMLSDVFNEPFYIAGQGDKSYIGALLKKHKNIEYVGVLKGKERVKFLQNAKVMVLGTQYFEPFGGAIIEGSMCGAYPVTSDFGVFPETIKNGYGATCRTFDDYVKAVEFGLGAPAWLHSDISAKYSDKYSMQNVSNSYHIVIEKIIAMHKYGWTGAENVTKNR
jgi:glycosyltransferase involved in cell wall biosynthesis